MIVEIISSSVQDIWCLLILFQLLWACSIRPLLLFGIYLTVCFADLWTGWCCCSVSEPCWVSVVFRGPQILLASTTTKFKVWCWVVVNFKFSRVLERDRLHLGFLRVDSLAEGLCRPWWFMFLIWSNYMRWYSTTTKLLPRTVASSITLIASTKLWVWSLVM